MKRRTIYRYGADRHGDRMSSRSYRRKCAFLRGSATITSHETGASPSKSLPKNRGVMGGRLSTGRCPTLPDVVDGVAGQSRRACLVAADVRPQQQWLITPGVRNVLRPKSAALLRCISQGVVWL